MPSPTNVTPETATSAVRPSNFWGRTALLTLVPATALLVSGFLLPEAGVPREGQGLGLGLGQGEAPSADHGAARSRPLQEGDSASSVQDDRGVRDAFAAAGVLLAPEAGALAFSVAVEVRSEPLEYLLVNPFGAAHESLFVTDVDAEVLATAFLAAGAEPGRNVDYVEKDPRPSEEELRSGVSTHDIVPPGGKPVYLYAAWREPAGRDGAESGVPEGESLHFHSVEDLVLDLGRDRTLRRHGWVWLGSRSVEEGDGDGPGRFAAKVTGNLACITFFSQGDTLLTTARAECAAQTNWYPNGWLLPAVGSGVLFMASMAPLEGVPAAFLDAVPRLVDPDPGADPRRR